MPHSLSKPLRIYYKEFKQEPSLKCLGGEVDQTANQRPYIRAISVAKTDPVQCLPSSACIILQHCVLVWSLVC